MRNICNYRTIKPSRDVSSALRGGGGGGAPLLLRVKITLPFGKRSDRLGENRAVPVLSGGARSVFAGREAALLSLWILLDGLKDEGIGPLPGLPSLGKGPGI